MHPLIGQDLDAKSLLGDGRAKAGVPLAGKQQDLKKYQNKVATDELTAVQRIGLARATPSPPAPPPPPAQQLWQTLHTPKPSSPTKSVGSSSLYRPKDLYEPLRQLLISPPVAQKDHSDPAAGVLNGATTHQIPDAAADSDADLVAVEGSPRAGKNPSQPAASAGMEAVMHSLDGGKLQVDSRPGSTAGATLPMRSGAEAKDVGAKRNAAGGHCQTLAEDLAYNWQDLQEDFQALAPHIRQVG